MEDLFRRLLGEKKGDWLAEKKAAEDDEDMFLEGFVGYCWCPNLELSPRESIITTVFPLLIVYQIPSMLLPYQSIEANLIYKKETKSQDLDRTRKVNSLCA